MARKTDISSMKVGPSILGLAGLVVLLAGVTIGTQLIQEPTQTAPKATGNGAPSGAHYNLNIIGVPKGKTADITSGNRIFVPLTGSCKISLAEGTYAVLDANCTDGKGSFQLPNPDPTNSGTTTYSVWARALGKPGGSSTTTTCAVDTLTQENYCSVYSMVQIRNKGKSTFADVSKELLYVYADINADGVLERMPLFDSRLQDYYWKYDNNGLKLVQLRFYEIPTTVPAP
ncbi:MAG: hypothetical protein Q7S03_02470 [bacterium]|nr:hypothetical protein [bacterium]